jgi:hypothetical protein
MSSAATTSPVTVPLDPGDDSAVTAALLAVHAPGAGSITLHPTPGLSNPTGIGHNLLVALGCPPHRLSAEHVTGPVPTWQAVAAWFTVDGVEQLVVLRAPAVDGDVGAVAAAAPPHRNPAGARLARIRDVTAGRPCARRRPSPRHSSVSARHDPAGVLTEGTSSHASVR